MQEQNCHCNPVVQQAGYNNFEAVLLFGDKKHDVVQEYDLHLDVLHDSYAQPIGLKAG